MIAPSFQDRISGAMIVDIGVTVRYDVPDMSGCSARRISSA